LPILPLKLVAMANLAMSLYQSEKEGRVDNLR